VNPRNSRLAPCSIHLKVRPCRAWLAAHTDRDDTIVYIGLDWSEPQRAPAITRGWAPWTVRYPMCEPPYLSTQDMLDWCADLGVTPPRLYSFGFRHNNCGGVCVRGGHKHWRHLLRVFPDRYAEAEQRETELRAELGDVAILRERRGGTSRPLTSPSCAAGTTTTTTADRRTPTALPRRCGAAARPGAQRPTTTTKEHGMDPNDPRWLQRLDIVTAWGEASARNGTPRPTDEQLWSTARRRQDLNLPKQIDADLLTELREAFNTGRHPTRIDLHAVADALHTRRHHAVVEHTGGNTATLYAGRQVPDRNGDPRWSVAAGPGWFDAPGHRQPVADTSEFHVGPDSDDTWAVAVPENPTTRQIADVIIAVIDHVEAQRSHFAAAADAARDAMWAAFAARYPEVATGDLAPGADHAFVAESSKVLAGWLDDNRPDTHTVPAHVAAVATNTAGATAREDRER